MGTIQSWRALTVADFGSIVTQAELDSFRNVSQVPGGVDAVTDLIKTVTATVRGAIAYHNVLEQDQSLLPAELFDVARWIVAAQVFGRLGSKASTEIRVLAIEDAYKTLSQFREGRSKLSSPAIPESAPSHQGVGAVEVVRSRRWDTSRGLSHLIG